MVYMADAIVNMSDAFAKMDGMEADIDALMYMIDDRAMKFLGLTEKDIKPIMDEIDKSGGELSGEMAGS